MADYRWNSYRRVFFLYGNFRDIGVGDIFLNKIAICLMFELDAPTMDANSKNVEQNSKVEYEQKPHHN